MNRKLAASISVVALCLITASTVGAARAGQLCRPFKQGGRSYSWETIGTGWTCSSAKPWVVKLIGDRIRTANANNPLTNGPRGLRCTANPLSRGGHATAGQCIKGTLAFPQSGFAWMDTSS